MADDGLLRVRDLLDGLGPRLGLGRAADTGVVWGKWREIVGPAIADHAAPSSLREGVLRVRADSPAWASELTYLAPEIRRRANELTGRTTVKEVRVWTGPGPMPAPEKSAPTPPPARSSKDATKAEGGDPKRAFQRAWAAWAKRSGAGSRRPPEIDQMPR